MSYFYLIIIYFIIKVNLLVYDHLFNIIIIIIYIFILLIYIIFYNKEKSNKLIVLSLYTNNKYIMINYI